MSKIECEKKYWQKYGNLSVWDTRLYTYIYIYI